MRHVSEEALEQYVLLHLSKNDSDAIAEHLVNCAKCRKRLARTQEFLCLVRKTLEPTSASAPPVCSYVSPSPIRWCPPAKPPTGGAKEALAAQSFHPSQVFISYFFLDSSD